MKRTFRSIYQLGDVSEVEALNDGQHLVVTSVMSKSAYEKFRNAHGNCEVRLKR